MISIKMTDGTRFDLEFFEYERSFTGIPFLPQHGFFELKNGSAKFLLNVDQIVSIIDKPEGGG